MHTQSRGPRAGGGRLERAIVLQLLCSDRDRSWPDAELGVELNADASDLQRALGVLEADGVVCVADGQARATRAVHRLDELELIGI